MHFNIIFLFNFWILAKWVIGIEGVVKFSKFPTTPRAGLWYIYILGIWLIFLESKVVSHAMCVYHFDIDDNLKVKLLIFFVDTQRTWGHEWVNTSSTVIIERNINRLIRESVAWLFIQILFFHKYWIHFEDLFLTLWEIMKRENWEEKCW